MPSGEREDAPGQACHIGVGAAQVLEAELDDEHKAGEVLVGGGAAWLLQAELLWLVYQEPAWVIFFKKNWREMQPMTSQPFSI